MIYTWSSLLSCRTPDVPVSAPPPQPALPAFGEGVAYVPPVPMIDAALHGRCPDPTPIEPTVPSGDDLHRVTLSGVASSCNDGTPPVLYVRAATDPAHADDWVLFIEGGKHCDLYEDCAVRWCGEEQYDASKMSSRWTPETRASTGIDTIDPDNTFAGYNHVQFYYCSSDRWTGSKRDHVFTDGAVPYRLHFLGSEILTDALDVLGEGILSDDGVETMPALDAAQRVVFSGSSAGGAGAVLNLDRVADALPGIEVIGLPDAVFYASLDVLDPDDAATLEQNTRERHEERVAVWNHQLDESCVAEHGADPICSNLDVVLREHVTTPFLLHHDLFDPIIYEGSFNDVMTLDEYAAAAVDTFSAWQRDGIGSVFLTGCGVHQYVPERIRFLKWTTAAPEGEAQSLHDAFADFASGHRPLYVLDDRNGTGSRCPVP